MIHNVKDMYELYQQSRLAGIKEVAIKADRLGLKDMADKIFALHFEIKKSLAKTATHFLGVKKIIKHIEITDRFDELSAADEISEMRFNKSFPIMTLQQPEDVVDREYLDSVITGNAQTADEQIQDQIKEEMKEEILNGRL